MDRTTRESDRQRPGFLRSWFPANDSQQEISKQSSESSTRGNSPRRLAFWVRLLLLVFLINLFFCGPLFFSLLSGQSTTIDLPYSRFLQQVEQGNVTSVTIKSDNSVTGTFRTPVRKPQTGTANGSVAATNFTTFIPTTGDPSLLPLLEKMWVEVSAQPVQPPWWQTALVVLLNSLPVLLLLYFGVMSWRSMRQM